MKRLVIPELLDTDSGSPEEIRGSLADLAFLNRYFGGHRTTCKLLREIARRINKNELTFLDVGGGTGEFANTVAHNLDRIGLHISSTVLDRVPSHFNGSRVNGVFRVSADAVQLPFREQAFDVVGSNLFCHHLEPNQLLQFLNEALRISKTAVILNDIQRNYFHWAASYAGFLFYRSRLTRHDAPASVRRAYTASELKELVSQTKASEVTARNYYFQRSGIILWR